MSNNQYQATMENMSTVEAMHIMMEAIANGDLVTINIKGNGYSHTITCNEGRVTDIL